MPAAAPNAALEALTPRVALTPGRSPNTRNLPQTGIFLTMHRAACRLRGLSRGIAGQCADMGQQCQRAALPRRSGPLPDVTHVGDDCKDIITHVVGFGPSRKQWLWFGRSLLPRKQGICRAIGDHSATVTSARCSAFDCVGGSRIEI
jgi:hypothetical protein